MIKRAVAVLCAAGSLAAADSLLLPSDAASGPAKIERLLLLDAAKAGKRLVAVGERGRVIVSDDAARSWRYAQSPTEATLTAVFFADDRLGWAAGHDAVILRTEDGGGTWQQVHAAPEADQPLLDIWFRDETHGLAVGAYGSAYVSDDGGRSWNAAQITDGDRHLNAIAGGTSGTVYIAGESGTVLRSEDGGKSWSKLATPYAGSYFGVLRLPDGNPLVFGLRGKVFRSTNGGRAWQSVATGSEASIIGGVVSGDDVYLVGYDGTVLASGDGGQSFSLHRAADRKALAAVVPTINPGILVVGEGGLTTLELRRAVD